MKVLFVYTVSHAPAPPAKPILEWIEISFSIAYLSAVLKRAGHRCELVVFRHGKFCRELERALASFEPDLVCHSAVTTEFPLVRRIAAAIRRRSPELYQVVGGVHVSVRPEDAFPGPFDAACVGEGEAALLELVESLERGERPAGIESFWFADGAAVQENPTRPFQEALDELPFPDRELWRPWIEEEPKHALLVGRGCPFSCGYCSNHALRQLADGKYVRLRSPGSVLAELRALCAEFPRATYVYFEIETITADQRWALELAALLEEFNAARAEPLDFAINLRVLRRVSFAELFAALKRAGFSYLRIGIESGSERVRREILHRDHTNQDLVATFEDAHRAGLETYAYNLIGLPGETPADFLETVELNRRCAATRSYISIFYPYPGTDLERVCAERGIRVPALVDSAERYRARLGLPEFPNRQVERYFRRFHSLVSGKREPLSRRLDAYVWQTLNGYPRLARWARRHTGHGVLSGLRRRWRALGAWLPTNGAKRS